MGKIKGWTRSRQEKNLYNHGETINQMPDGYLKIFKKNNSYFILVKRPRQPEIIVNYRMIHTMEEAKDFAIRYMKSHPRG